MLAPKATRCARIPSRVMLRGGDGFDKQRRLGVQIAQHAVGVDGFHAEGAENGVRCVFEFDHDLLHVAGHGVRNGQGKEPELDAYLFAQRLNQTFVQEGAHDERAPDRPLVHAGQDWP